MRSSSFCSLSRTRRLAAAATLPCRPARSALESGEAAPYLIGRPLRQRRAAARRTVRRTVRRAVPHRSAASWCPRRKTALAIGWAGGPGTGRHAGPGNAYRKPGGRLTLDGRIAPVRREAAVVAGRDGASPTVLAAAEPA